MIGLAVCVFGLLWLAAAAWLSSCAPRWLNIQKHRTLFGWALFPVILLLPFVDHIIGMWQFHRLCEQHTRLHVRPEASNTLRAQQLPLEIIVAAEFPIEIIRYHTDIIDLDTGKVIAGYSSLNTEGGWGGRIVALGRRYSCEIDQSHPDRDRFIDFKKRTQLRY